MLSINPKYFRAVKMINHLKCSSRGHKKKNTKPFLTQSLWVRAKLWHLEGRGSAFPPWGQEEMERTEINWKMALMLGSLFSSSTRNLLLVFISNSEVFKKNSLNPETQTGGRSQKEKAPSLSPSLVSPSPILSSVFWVTQELVIYDAKIFIWWSVFWREFVPRLQTDCQPFPKIPSQVIVPRALSVLPTSYK